MNKKHQAYITWLTKDQGGRKNPPPIDLRFGCIIVAKDKVLNANEACWSLIIDIKEKVSEFETVAEVNYLSEKAPNELVKGYEFDLYDGKKLVAQGIIL